MTENVFDIETKKPVKPEMAEDVTISRWFDTWKRYAKGSKITTLAIVGVDDQGNLYQDIYNPTEIGLLRLYRECDNLKAVIDIFLYPDEEDDE